MIARALILALAIVALALILALAIVELAVCHQTGQTETARPVVVASFYPLYDFARHIAGDRAEVVCLVPPGGCATA